VWGRLTPTRILFGLYPLCFVGLSILLKCCFKQWTWANKFILFLVYVLSNIAIFFYIKGGLIPIGTMERALGISVFSGLQFKQWIRLILIPNTFTIIYVLLVFLILYVPNWLKSWLAKRNIMVVHSVWERGKKY
jgi:hypothetical protein